MVAEPVEHAARPTDQRVDPLDGVDAQTETAEDRRLVAGAGADLQHPLGAFELQGLGHQGDNVGLGDGLAAADGQGKVPVGMGLHGVLDEQVPRHLAHGLEHPRIADAARHQLLLDHALAVDGKGRRFAH